MRVWRISLEDPYANFSLLLLTAWLLAACSVTPPPVPPPVYYPPVDYGPPAICVTHPKARFSPMQRCIFAAGRVTNAPPFDSDGRMIDFNPIIIVENTIVMASVPANEVCMSSGYGMRNGRLHKGSDYAPRPKGGERAIYTAAPGRVREAGWATGLGYQVLIDHGQGIYTRYAHLKSIEDWVGAGRSDWIWPRAGLDGCQRKYDRGTFALRDSDGRYQ